MPVSFSVKVKEELSRVQPAARHCQIAETSAMILLAGNAVMDGQNDLLSFRTENVTVARKYFTLLKKTFNIKDDIVLENEPGLNRNHAYFIRIDRKMAQEKVLPACGLCFSESGQIILTDELVCRKDCCRRSFLRGAFLASGSITDPVRSYHFEIVCADESRALLLQKLITSFEIPARVILRKSHYVVYVKDGSQVVDLLNIMGAYKALMDMENVRIVKDMRNRVNRSVNCETANINKAVNAAVRQINDIETLQKAGAFRSLPDPLREVALLRLEYPDATLSELGRMLSPPVGKSGVNHRLSRISRYAEEIGSRPPEIINDTGKER